MLGGHAVAQCLRNEGVKHVFSVPGESYIAVVDGSRVALMKPIDVPNPAAEARTRMLRHLASETQPELRDVRIVRSAADLDPRMPRFVTAYLLHMWRGHTATTLSNGENL